MQVSLLKKNLIIKTKNKTGFTDYNMINDYRLLKKLGEGSTAQVWEAIQETTKAKCALKIFATQKNPDLKELVRNEVDQAAKV